MSTMVLENASIANLWTPPDVHYPSAAIEQFRPHLEFAIRFRNIISSLSVFLCWQAYCLSSIALQNALYVSKILAFQAYLSSKYGVWYTWLVSSSATSMVWNSRIVQEWRKNSFHNFAVFILGSGNGLILVLFWPGWLLIGGASLAVWQLAG